MFEFNNPERATLIAECMDALLSLPDDALRSKKENQEFQKNLSKSLAALNQARKLIIMDKVVRPLCAHAYEAALVVDRDSTEQTGECALARDTASRLLQAAEELYGPKSAKDRDHWMTRLIPLLSGAEKSPRGRRTQLKDELGELFKTDPETIYRWHKASLTEPKQGPTEELDARLKEKDIAVVTVADLSMLPFPVEQRVANIEKLRFTFENEFNFGKFDADLLVRLSWRDGVLGEQANPLGDTRAAEALRRRVLDALKVWPKKSDEELAKMSDVERDPYLKYLHPGPYSCFATFGEHDSVVDLSLAIETFRRDINSETPEDLIRSIGIVADLVGARPFV